MTCHLLFLYHTLYYQKSRTQIIYWQKLDVAESEYKSVFLLNFSK
ncbi:hypothetical protein RintRC_5311 [Richelia intracellularis]|nr:hypothetical protein RintRC_5311 [Richelia intracellularis]